MRGTQVDIDIGNPKSATTGDQPCDMPRVASWLSRRHANDLRFKQDKVPMFVDPFYYFIKFLAGPAPLSYSHMRERRLQGLAPTVAHKLFEAFHLTYTNPFFEIQYFRETIHISQYSISYPLDSKGLSPEKTSEWRREWRQSGRT